MQVADNDFSLILIILWGLIELTTRLCSWFPVLCCHVFHRFFLLGSFDEFHLCTSAHHQEQMKEIEKLFQTEFDYVEEFRILAVRDCQG